jgi:arylsulfatase A-like enzyme
MRLSRRRFLTLLGLAGGMSASPLLSACVETAAPSPPTTRTPSAATPNVLVIVLDTLRYDRFTRPAEQSLTPNLDRLTENGVRFENAWATSSWSLPAQASILTGRYAHEHGADWPGLRLDGQHPTLAEFFARQGYVTGAFSGNASWVSPEYLGRGFLRFDVYLIEDLLRRTAHGRTVDRVLQEVGYHYAGRGKKAPTLNGQFLQFLGDYRGRPFFAYLCYMDVNQGFHARRFNTYFRKLAPTHEVIEAYDLALRELDAQVGILFTELERRSLLENTLVIITSDHGESFGAEGTDDHDPSGHGTSLYPEQLQVPLFVVYAARLPPGRRVRHTVSIRAIPAMITRLLGLERSPFGGSPLPLAEDPPGAPEDKTAVLATLNYDDHKLQSVVRDHWQYIRNLRDPRGGEELYDLAADPLAKVNLGWDHPLIDPMRELLQQSLASKTPGPAESL